VAGVALTGGTCEVEMKLSRHRDTGGGITGQESKETE